MSGKPSAVETSQDENPAPEKFRESNTTLSTAHVSPSFLDRNDPAEIQPPVSSPDEEAGVPLEAYLATRTSSSSKPKKILASVDKVVDPEEEARKNRVRIRWIALGVLIIFAAALFGIVVGVMKRQQPQAAAVETGSPSTAPTLSPAPSMPPSPSPSSSPTSEFLVLVLEDIRDALSLDEYLNVEEALKNSSDPIYKAAKWIALEDTFFDFPLNRTEFASGTEAADVNILNLVQRFGLAVFFFATGGDASWTETCNFLSPTDHVCDWKCEIPQDVLTAPIQHENAAYFGISDTLEDELFGYKVSANGTAPMMGIHCVKDVFSEAVQDLTEDGVVDEMIVSLELVANNLIGTLPPIFGIVMASVLNLNFNQLSGTIPWDSFQQSPYQLRLGHNRFSGGITSDVGSLSNLIDLDVSGNELVGSIPAEFASLSNLVSFTGEYNFMTGKLPPGFQEMAALQQFWIHDNAFSGPLPNVFDMPQMLNFDVGWNVFTGPLPSTHNGTASQLQALWAPLNQLTGTLSQWNAPNLTDFVVHDNLFSGTVPRLDGLTTLQLLHLGNNQLTGNPFDTSQFHQLSTLWAAVLSSNQFNGTLQGSYFDAPIKTSLSWGFSVFNNSFTGTLPTEIGLWTGLQQLSVQTNQLSGTLPTELMQLINAYYVRLQKNDFIGDVTPYCEQQLGIFRGRDFEFEADCPNEVACGDCCTLCCDDATQSCVIN